ncbi:hypothetical protein DERF_005034 [Dermatophagoides farinae]|uniref:Uncharacterized protein n=1 Tax=Dermatophagoides farinae TaxID=6954 RepID=A0A922I608_DERFA|nr:hypothetical protein DERF_005034 [Dermatophagoides farinae]
MALRKKHSINNYFNHFFLHHISRISSNPFFNVQFITGHGLFMSYLHRINVNHRPHVNAAIVSDPSHILFNCSRHRQFQHNLSSPSEFMLKQM